MGAQLTIKSDDAYHPASRLPDLTGEHLTAVAAKALQPEQQRRGRTSDREEPVWCARQIADADNLRHLKLPLPSSNRHWRHDENGLPR